MGRPKKEINNVEEIHAKDNAPENKTSVIGGGNSSLKALMKKNENDHLNYVEAVNYKVSTGVLMMDMEMGGGVNAGLVRVGGATESGKSSFTLEVLRNFFELHKTRGKGLYVKAEGRLSEEMMKRTGLKFVSDPMEWVVGTVLVLESNIYEFIIDCLRDCVLNNPDGFLYFIVIDSMDGLIMRDDVPKDITDGSRVAGNPRLTKLLLQKMANSMTKHGHLLFMLSQVSASIDINPYAPKTYAPVKNMAGGNASNHFANWIIEFQPVNPSQKVFATSDNKITRENRPIGHQCRIVFRKTVNEKTGFPVEYYVKYGVQNGSSVWIERDIADFAVANRLFKRDDSGLEVDESFKKELIEAGFEVGEKYKNIDKIYAWLEKNPEITKFLHEKFKKVVCVNV